MAKTKDTVGCTTEPTIRVNSGGYINLLDPKPSQFTFMDIARGLSKLCRYGGQIDRFYSVAEHSLNCAKIAEADGYAREVQAACLLHDAAEAFIGDIVKPLKNLLPEYHAFEERFDKLISEKYHVDFSHPAVKQIDWEMLFVERPRLFSEDSETWAGQDKIRKHPNLVLNCHTHDSIEQFFVSKAKALGINVNA